MKFAVPRPRDISEALHVYDKSLSFQSLKVNHWALALVKGIGEPHEVKEKSFQLCGNPTHDLRIRSTVTLPAELRGRTEKVGMNLGAEPWQRESKGTYECCAA